MTKQSVTTLGELKGRPLEEILEEVANQQALLVIRLRDGKEIVIAPRPQLEPLPELEGRVPEGWRDAVYARD